MKLSRSPRWLQSCARTSDLRRHFSLITLPVLIIHGTADKAAKPSGSRHFYEHAGSKDRTLKFYEGRYHDPLSDLGKEEAATHPSLRSDEEAAEHTDYVECVRLGPQGLHRRATEKKPDARSGLFSYA